MSAHARRITTEGSTGRYSGAETQISLGSFVAEIRSYREAAAGLEKSLAWLVDLGIQPQRGRLAAYTRAVAELADAQEEDRLGEFWRSDSSTRLLNTMTETSEWLTICDAFMGSREPNLARRLKQAVKGPENPYDENPDSSSNAPRNAVAELYLGARLKMRRFDVEFGDQGDLHVDYRGRRIYVECKRPQSEAKLEVRVQEALDQLEQRYSSDPTPGRARGIVAVSVTKALNPRGMGSRVPNRHVLRDQISQHVGPLIRRRAEHWIGPGVDPRTIGALIEYRQTFLVEDELVLLPAVDHALSVPVELPHEDRAWLHQFQMRFAGGVPPVPVRHTIPRTGR